MFDMLVRLYDLPDYSKEAADLEAAGTIVRRPLAPEKYQVIDWVRGHFSLGWSSECDVSFARAPISCFIAIKHGKLVGFACYDSTCKNFFGPTGVLQSERGSGIGRILLWKCLQAMKDGGYAYAVIGGVGPAEFYSKTVGAFPIEGSEPGIYRGLLRRESDTKVKAEKRPRKTKS
ncbi:GNAT family N-acetyltransferase [bacterium]|nr:GNAT family N-acetyltransferase [bacterium]